MNSYPTFPPLAALIDDAAIAQARAAAVAEAEASQVGEQVGLIAEDKVSVTHLFAAEHPGYRGWQWAVTIALSGPNAPITVSEVVLLPGDDALLAPDWVPWQERIRAGDLGVGDLLPTGDDDYRLVSGTDASSDLSQTGPDSIRVLSSQGVAEAVRRWKASEFGPYSDMALRAPANCATCGFYALIAGPLGRDFGVCTNELSPADAHVVHADYGCGAHSDVAVDITAAQPIAELVYDDSTLEIVGNGSRIVKNELFW